MSKQKVLLPFLAFLMGALVTIGEARAQGVRGGAITNRLQVLDRIGAAGPPTRATQLREQLGGGGLAMLALEGAIDEATYILGPGDQLSLIIGGAVPIQVAVPISADGYLILAEARAA